MDASDEIPRFPISNPRFRSSPGRGSEYGTCLVGLTPRFVCPSAAAKVPEAMSGQSSKRLLSADNSEKISEDDQQVAGKRVRKVSQRLGEDEDFSQPQDADTESEMELEDNDDDFVPKKKKKTTAQPRAVPKAKKTKQANVSTDASNSESNGDDDNDEDEDSDDDDDDDEDESN